MSGFSSENHKNAREGAPNNQRNRLPPLKLQGSRQILSPSFLYVFPHGLAASHNYRFLKHPPLAGHGALGEFEGSFSRSFSHSPPFGSQ